MKAFAKALMVVFALVACGSTAEAQGARRLIRPVRPTRSLVAARVQARRLEGRRLRQRVLSGELSRRQARVQLRKWQRANRPPRPARLRVRGPF